MSLNRVFNRVRPAGRSKPVLLLVIGCALAMSAVLAACGSDSSSNSGDGPVTARLPFAPGSLDPHVGPADIAGEALAAYAYDSPVAVRGGEVVPQLASKWEVTPTSITLTLKPDISCSDGTPLTVNEVVDSINRMKDPKVGAANTVQAFGTPDGFEASADEGASTVTVELDEPYGDLLVGMSHVAIICRAGLEAPEKLEDETFGSGPYVLESAVSGDHYTYTVHEGYDWGPDGASNDESGVPSGITFQVIENETTATNQFLTGTLDLTIAEGPDQARLDESDKVTTQKSTPISTFFVQLNHREGHPAADVELRRMFVAALDRADFAQAVVGPGTVAPETLIFPDGICYQPDQVGDSMIPFSVSEAQKYAEAAGYELVDGKLVKDGEQLTVKVVIPDLIGQAAADYLISAWGDAGIKVDAQVLPTAQAVEVVFTPGGDWDLFVAGGEYSTPTHFVSELSGPPPPEGANYGEIQNEEFLKIATEAKGESTQEVCDKWAAAERALYEDADLIPWALPEATWYGDQLTFDPWLLTAVYPDSLRWVE